MFFNLGQNLNSQVDELLKFCYKMRQNGANKDQEITYLIAEIENCWPKLSAAGCFSIDRRAFIDSVSAMATYFIVCIQFNKLFANRMDI